MRIDELPFEEQDGTPYCFSCGAVRSKEELSTCTRCGAPLCGMDGCKSRCECEDILDGILDEIG